MARAAAKPHPQPAAPEHLSSVIALRSNRPLALAALAALAVTCFGLAACFAAPGSNVVLATAGGSPDWLLGPLRVFGLDAADGPLSGPGFYLGLWLALIFYVIAVWNAGAVGPRLAIGTIAGLQVLFFLAPPLLSQDIFSYIAYARLDIVHGLNPYTHSPNAVPGDAVYGFAGSKDATSAYGPLFTIVTLPLAKLDVSTAYWILKLVMLVASLGIVAFTWRAAQLLGRDPVPAAMFVGLNPIVLVHVVGGAHNDALMMLFVMAAVVSLLSARVATGGTLAAVGAGVKASAAIVFPFMFAGAQQRTKLVVGAALATVAMLLAGVLAFGSKAIDALILIGQNQEKTTRWSIPQKIADGIATLTGGDAGSIVGATRAVLAIAFLVLFVWLLREAWLRREQPGFWIAAAGWATLGLLCATAWLVPWYAIWLLPLAAVAGSRRLAIASVAICAYMLVIAVPL